jgi:hypothetical protein
MKPKLIIMSTAVVVLTYLIVYTFITNDIPKALGATVIYYVIFYILPLYSYKKYLLKARILRKMVFVDKDGKPVIPPKEVIKKTLDEVLELREEVIDEVRTKTMCKEADIDIDRIAVQTDGEKTIAIQVRCESENYIAFVKGDVIVIERGG